MEKHTNRNDVFFFARKLDHILLLFRTSPAPPTVSSRNVALGWTVEAVSEFFICRLGRSRGNAQRRNDYGRTEQYDRLNKVTHKTLQLNGPRRFHRVYRSGAKEVKVVYQFERLSRACAYTYRRPFPRPAPQRLSHRPHAQESKIHGQSLAKRPTCRRWSAHLVLSGDQE